MSRSQSDYRGARRSAATADEPFVPRYTGPVRRGSPPKTGKYTPAEEARNNSAARAAEMIGGDNGP